MTFTSRKTFRTLAASLALAALASTAIIAPAAAGGSFSISYLPGNAQDANALRTGLQLYSIFNAAQNGASINQNGMNNLAGLGQNGVGNLGIIHQEGNGHSGSLQQNGNNNAYGIFQFGENTSANVSQYGNSQTGTTLVFGW